MRMRPGPFNDDIMEWDMRSTCQAAPAVPDPEQPVPVTTTVSQISEQRCGGCAKTVSSLITKFSWFLSVLFLSGKKTA